MRGWRTPRRTSAPWSPMKSNKKGPQMSRMGQGALGPKGRRVADVQSSWGLGAPPKGPTLAEDRFAGAETQTHAPGPQVRHSIHQATARP